MFNDKWRWTMNWKEYEIKKIFKFFVWNLFFDVFKRKVLIYNFFDFDEFFIDVSSLYVRVMGGSKWIYLIMNIWIKWIMLIWYGRVIDDEYNRDGSYFEI